ncbi:uncharacterized protein LOC130692528 isoform X1 [Daphnia carinata]|uniref:uncharacterized protein LOC130692528 isoform X1 n=1 Tax=Daphnia carinata TaxID=120202 RepID=UPI00257C2C95|nr:uncharacterized protein LOC130692528 isoform X1 [Daphnia carinata]
MLSQFVILLCATSTVFSDRLDEADKGNELQSEERCNLPPVKPDSFICSLTIIPSWTFNSKAGECQSYAYGGCGKTSNLFASLEECKTACLKEKASLPNSTISVRQNATVKSSRGVCRYRDVTYIIGQEILQINQDDACKTDCKCGASDNQEQLFSKGGATIKCNQISCDEPLPPQEEGCVLVTLPGACCPSIKCPERSLAGVGPSDDICVYNGKGYLKGQSIPTGEICRKCTCVKGFYGLFGPGCQEVHCILDDRIGCTPVYTPGICCPTSYKCNSPITEVFPQIKSDLSRIKWGHGINSRIQLYKSLHGRDMMIEADVSVGTITGGDATIMPIMAHPPLNTSDLSLEEFLDTILDSNTTKGIKLDFKDLEVVELSLVAIKSRASKIIGPLWLNADILPGPVNASTKPVEALRFLSLAKDYFPDAVLSVGWTTRFGPQMAWPLQIINEGSYTLEHVAQMRDALKAAQIRQPVTFPVRAGLLTSSESQKNILWLLEEIEGSTLTIWSSQYDTVDVPALMKLVNHIGKENIYVDVPSGLNCEIQHYDEQFY